MIKNLLSLVAGDRKAEGPQGPEMIGKALLNQFQNLFGRLVWVEAKRLGDRQPFFRRLAVFGVEIPASTDRFAVGHQKTCLAPHGPVEILHAQLAAALSPFHEFRFRAEKTSIFKKVQGHIEPVSERFQFF